MKCSKIRVGEATPVAERPRRVICDQTIGANRMILIDHLAKSNNGFRWFCVATALIFVGSSSQAKAEEFEGPSFRKGLWHFVRTLDLVAHRKNKYRLQEREMTRCVDPTVAMKATFASPSVGNCVSAKPEKSDNQYTFSNRCDYMGPVSTVITVRSEESYTEVNELTVGKLPRVESVVANRVGDCQEEAQKSGGPLGRVRAGAVAGDSAASEPGGAAVETAPPRVAHAIGR